jgi:sulfide:quinone oxidoreductase
MWKKSYRDLFFMTNGKVLGFGLNIGQFSAEKVF